MRCFARKAFGVALLIGGCGESAGTLRWNIAWRDNALLERAARVTARIREDRCDGTVLATYEVTAEGMEESPGEITLAPGRWAFEAEAVDSDCVLFADVCVERTLDGSDEDVTLGIESVEETSECSLALCDRTRCALPIDPADVEWTMEVVSEGQPQARSPWIGVLPSDEPVVLYRAGTADPIFTARRSAEGSWVSSTVVLQGGEHLSSRSFAAAMISEGVEEPSAALLAHVGPDQLPAYIEPPLSSAPWQYLGSSADRPAGWVGLDLDSMEGVPSVSFLHLPLPSCRIGWRDAGSWRFASAAVPDGAAILAIDTSRIRVAQDGTAWAGYLLRSGPMLAIGQLVEDAFEVTDSEIAVDAAASWDLVLSPSAVPLLVLTADDGIEVHRRTRDGEWALVERVVPESVPEFVTAHIDDAGQFHGVARASTGELLYVAVGNEGLADAPIPGTSRPDERASLAVDSLGNVHVLFVDATTGALMYAVGRR